MSALAVFRTMMNRLGFSIAAAEHIYTNQGIDLLEELACLSVEVISNLMKAIRRGGH